MGGSPLGEKKNESWLTDVATQVKEKWSKLKSSHPEHEAVEIGDALFRIKAASDAVDTRTRFLRDQKLIGIDAATRALPETMEQGFLRFREQAEQFMSNMVLALDRTVSEAEKRRSEEALRLQTGMYHMVSEYLLQVSPPTPYLCATAYDSQGSVSPLGSPGLPVVSPFIEVELERVFAAIGISSSPYPGQEGPNIRHITDDLEAVLRRTCDIADSDLSRTSYLMRDPRFLSWLDTDVDRAQLDLLLINGYFDTYSDRSISPLSVFTAFFASGVVAQSQKHIVLHHFSSLHTNRAHDPLAGPHGLLRRLIAQLLINLARFNVNTLFLDGELLDDCGLDAAHDLHALCELFGRLLEEVPEGVAVFILIENISNFETSLYGWMNEVDFVVQRLSGLGKPRSPGDGPSLAPDLKASVRVLMTCGMKSVKVSRWLKPAKCLSLEAVEE